MFDGYFCFREIEPDFDPGAAIMVNSTSNMPDHLQAIDKEFNEIIQQNNKESIRQYLRKILAGPDESKEVLILEESPDGHCGFVACPIKTGEKL